MCNVSFHDFAADALWLSEDFLLPEDHQLVEDSLSGRVGGNSEITYGAHDGTRYAVAIPVRDAQGAVNGAVRLYIDSQIIDGRAAEPLESRLAPVLVCLAAEFERRGALPSLPREDEVQLAEIESALHAERFELFLQPIRSLHEDEGLAHYEVLLRLRTADGELLEPGAFLSTAADRRMMPAIDRWVLRTLLVWLVNNRKLWTRVPVVFSINLAPQSMTDARFVSYVEQCVIKSGVPPQALCFEIKERFASSGNISVAESMNRLEALGCEVALDDFGGHAPSYGRSALAHGAGALLQDRQRAGRRRPHRPGGAGDDFRHRAHGGRSRDSNGGGVRGIGLGVAGGALARGRLCAGISPGPAQIDHRF